MVPAATVPPVEPPVLPPPVEPPVDPPVLAAVSVRVSIRANSPTSLVPRIAMVSPELSDRFTVRTVAALVPPAPVQLSTVRPFTSRRKSDAPSFSLYQPMSRT